jgi:hypothetical protein
MMTQPYWLHRRGTPQNLWPVSSEDVQLFVYEMPYTLLNVPGSGKLKTGLRVFLYPGLSEMSEKLAAFQKALLVRQVVAKFVESKEFPSEEALEWYLHNHPKADPHKHTVKKPGKKKPSKVEKVQQVGRGVKEFLSKAPSSVASFVKDPESRKSTLQKIVKGIKSAPGRLGRQAVHHVKHEVKEWKEAGVAVGKLVKGEKLEPKEKKALKAAAAEVALVVAVTALTGGLASGLSGLGKKSALHLAQAVGKKIALNAVSNGILGKLPAMEEAAHGAHGGLELIQHVLKLSAEEASSDELLGHWVEAAVMKELENLDENTITEAL